MWKQLRISVVFLGIVTVLTGVLYPLVVTVVAQMFAPHRANGSLLNLPEKADGSEFIGQPFSKPEYFWGRLSATAPFPYNAAASSGSNFGPMHADLAKHAQERIEALRKYDPTIESVPADLVTASASGLDPHLSPAAVQIQMKRVAEARTLTVDDLQRLVAACTEGRQFGVLGEPRVNVLRLNLALDDSTKRSSGR